MKQAAKTDPRGENGPTDDASAVLAQHVENAYLMLFEDRFTVILDDAGRFQKSFDLEQWLSRFGEDDAIQLRALRDRIEARLAVLDT